MGGRASGRQASGWGWFLGAVALAAASQSGPALAAGVSGDLRAGFYFDSERAHIGGGIVAPISRSGHWYINPNLEMALSDVSDLFALSADVEYTFNSQPSLLFWVGGGPSLLIEDAPGGSDTSAGLNLIFGLGGRRGPVRPFGQFKAVLADDSEIVLTGGIRF